MNKEKNRQKKDIGAELEELNQLYQMLKGEVGQKKKSTSKTVQNKSLELTKSKTRITFDSILILPTKNGENKRINLKISFRNGKVGFRVSNSTIKQFEETKTVMTATIPNPDFTHYILRQKESVISMVLRDIALTAFLSHDIKKSLNQSPLTEREWEKLNDYLKPPKIRFQKVGLMFGLMKNYPAWGTVLHSIAHEHPKNRYQTIFIQESPFKVPKVKFINQRIASGIHHKYGSTEPCIMHQNKWYEGSTIYTAIGRTIAWITAYEHWKQTGIWPGE